MKFDKGLIDSITQIAYDLLKNEDSVLTSREVESELYLRNEGNKVCSYRTIQRTLNTLVQRKIVSVTYNHSGSVYTKYKNDCIYVIKLYKSLNENSIEKNVGYCSSLNNAKKALLNYGKAFNEQGTYSYALIEKVYEEDFPCLLKEDIKKDAFKGWWFAYNEPRQKFLSISKPKNFINQHLVVKSRITYLEV